MALFKKDKKEKKDEIEKIIETVETIVETPKETVIEKQVPKVKEEEQEDVLTKSKREFNSSIARLNNYRSRYGRK